MPICPKLSFFPSYRCRAPKGRKWRQANLQHTNSVGVQLSTCDKQKRDSVESVAFYDPTHFDNLAVARGYEQCSFFIWQFLSWKTTLSPLMDLIVRRAFVAASWGAESKACQCGHCILLPVCQRSRTVNLQAKKWEALEMIWRLLLLCNTALCWLRRWSAEDV